MRGRSPWAMPPSSDRAYTSALLYTEAGLPFWFSVPLAAIVSGGVGALLGIPCLRVRDDFLAITTMGINFVVEAVFLYLPFFGGAMGIGGINLPGWFGREMTKPEFFVLILAVLALLLLLDRKLGRSWIGLAWASIREDEQAAEAMGVDVVRFKVLAFILGSSIAGLAGGFYAHFLTFIMPQNFGFPMSIVILSMVVFGGIGTRWGPWWERWSWASSPRFPGRSWSTGRSFTGCSSCFMMRFQPEGLLGFDSFLMRGVRRIVPRPSGSG